MLLIDGSVQERCNSIANALELHLSCTNPSICVGISKLGHHSTCKCLSSYWFHDVISISELGHIVHWTHWELIFKEMWKIICGMAAILSRFHCIELIQLFIHRCPYEQKIQRPKKNRKKIIFSRKLNKKCCLSGAKPLPKSILAYSQPQRNIFQWSFIWNLKSFNSWRHIWKCLLLNGNHFVPTQCVNLRRLLMHRCPPGRRIDRPRNCRPLLLSNDLGWLSTIMAEKA